MAVPPGSSQNCARALLVELWAESFHGSGAYVRLVQRVRPTDARGRAVLQLQDQLHAVLTPERPDLTRAAGLVRLTAHIRRYYATVADKSEHKSPQYREAKLYLKAHKK